MTVCRGIDQFPPHIRIDSHAIMHSVTWAIKLGGDHPIPGQTTVYAFQFKDTPWSGTCDP